MVHNLEPSQLLVSKNLLEILLKSRFAQLFRQQFKIKTEQDNGFLFTELSRSFIP